MTPTSLPSRPVPAEPPRRQRFRAARRFRLVSWSLVACALIATADARPVGGAPARAAAPAVRERAYLLPAYDSLSAGLRREVDHVTTRAEYERFAADRRYVLRKLEYPSDSLRVVAYEYGPATTERAPVIVYCRGSWVAGDLAPALLPVFHRLAEAGYRVLAPQYRGSDGGEGTDDMGGADVDDVRHAIELAMNRPGADGGRVYLYGESRGGMMTLQCLRDQVPVRAAAVVGAFTDLDSLLAGDERSRGAAGHIWPDFAARHGELALRRSAVRWADSLRTPLLILHGGADRGVSPRQALALASRLDAAGREYELHVVAGGSHTLAERGAMRDSAVVAWFRAHE